MMIPGVLFKVLLVKGESNAVLNFHPCMHPAMMAIPDLYQHKTADPYQPLERMTLQMDRTLRILAYFILGRD
jgi:hypothetical protein